MAVKRINVWNIMVFQRKSEKRDEEDREACGEERKNGDFCLQFCDGINVLIGENGVGKTTLLKMIYAALQCSDPQKHMDKTGLLEFFHII